MAQTLPDLFLSYGVEAGREVIYVDLDGRDGEFPFASEVDLQIDLFEARFSALQIRRIMDRMRFARAMYAPHHYDEPPREEYARQHEERPSAAGTCHGREPAGFEWNGWRVFTCFLGAGLATIACLLLAQWLGVGGGL